MNFIIFNFILVSTCAVFFTDVSSLSLADDEPPILGCEDWNCAPEYYCIEDENGAASCVKPKNSGCMLVKCTATTHCEEDASGHGSCVPNEKLTCATVKCRENNVCVEKPEGPACVCAPGYDGDPCKPVPKHCPDEEPPVLGCEVWDCAPGYHCIEDENGAGSCVPDEEVPILTCASVLCIENSRCIENDGNPYCVCLPGYAGKYCEPVSKHCPPDEEPPVAGCEVIDCAPGYDCVEDEYGDGSCVPIEEGGKCALVDCFPDKICVEKHGKAVCVCPPGSAGDPCKPVGKPPTEIFGCENIDCAEGYKCVEDKKGAGSCVPIGKCALVRCPENTVCVENKKGEASCVCAPGYAGKPCKLVGKPHTTSGCAATTCLENTYCVEDKKGQASCVPNEKLTCATVKCGGNQICVEKNNGPKCVCAPGYAGNPCKQVSKPCPSDGPSDPVGPCALALCPPNTICVEKDGVASCKRRLLTTDVFEKLKL